MARHSPKNYPATGTAVAVSKRRSAEVAKTLFYCFVSPHAVGRLLLQGSARPRRVPSLVATCVPCACNAQEVCVVSACEPLVGVAPMVCVVLWSVACQVGALPGLPPNDGYYSECVCVCVLAAEHL